MKEKANYMLYLYKEKEREKNKMICEMFVAVFRTIHDFYPINGVIRGIYDSSRCRAIKSVRRGYCSDPSCRGATARSLKTHDNFLPV